MRFWFVWMWVLFSVVACSDDTTGSGTVTCEFGERFNAIENKCEPVLVGDNNTSSNNDGNNTASNNANNTTSNNANNTAGNNNTPTNNDNNSTDPDMGTVEDMDTPDLPPQACGTGTLIGKACSPDGDVLAAADVTVTGVDCATGQPFELTGRTDGAGGFQVDNVPSGQHTLTIATGSFSGSSQFFVRAGQTTDLTAAADKLCLDAAAVKIAVIGGAYDHVEGIISDLNLTYDMKGDDGAQLQATRTFLQDPAAMAAYDIIFINCGDLWNTLAPLFGIGTDPRPAIANNLRNFVNQGGSVYVADWAAPWAETAFPEIMDMVGDDTNVNDARVGFAPQTIMADVLSTELQAVLNSQTATIEFPHMPPTVINNNWAVLAGADPTAVVHLSGDAALCGPSAGGFSDPCPAGGGTQADAPLLLTWKATSGGTVTYTSFHNERQGGVNQDMSKILRFLIFQL